MLRNRLNGKLRFVLKVSVLIVVLVIITCQRLISVQMAARHWRFDDNDEARLVNLPAPRQAPRHWVFNDDGELVEQPGPEDAYNADTEVDSTDTEEENRRETDAQGAYLAELADSDIDSSEQCK